MIRIQLITACILLPVLSAFCQIEEYVLQAGDVISIQVVEHPEFSGQHKIRPDGRINYPVIGEVEVSTLTPAQLVKIMQGKLAAYVNNPVVSVSIESYYANKIFIIGAVQRSGQFEIYEPVDVLKALAMCGGMSAGKIKVLKIIRADGSTIDVATQGLYEGKGKNKYLLYPGDTLYAPEPVKIPWSMLSTILSLAGMTISLIIGVNTLSKL